MTWDLDVIDNPFNSRIWPIPLLQCGKTVDFLFLIGRFSVNAPIVWIGFGSIGFHQRDRIQFRGDQSRWKAAIRKITIWQTVKHIIRFSGAAHAHRSYPQYQPDRMWSAYWWMQATGNSVLDRLNRTIQPRYLKLNAVCCEKGFQEWVLVQRLPRVWPARVLAEEQPVWGVPEEAKLVHPRTNKDRQA